MSSSSCSLPRGGRNGKTTPQTAADINREMAMTTMVWTYLVYLGVSIALTVWVAQTLQKSGLIFLVDAFRGNEKLANSVNHLLAVGFYLINIGFVSLALQFGGKANSVQEAIEYLSLKVGLVLVLLGVMHFGNLIVFSKLRRRALRPAPAPLLDALPAEASPYMNRLQHAREETWNK
jgi:hypothetical protein